MTDQTLLRRPASFQDLFLTLRDLTFRVALNKTVRASGASQAWQLSQPVQAKRARAGGDLSKLTTLFKSKFGRLGTLMLTF